jgi:hypothetical protein
VRKRKVDTVRKLVFIAALLASTPAFAWTWETDDGRKVTNIQADREGAACAVVAGGVMDTTWVTCMRAKGYIVHICTPYFWVRGSCT